MTCDPNRSVAWSKQGTSYVAIFAPPILSISDTVYITVFEY